MKIAEYRAALGDRSSVRRSNAALGLMKMGRKANAAAPELIKLLQDEDDVVRYWTARALGAIDPEGKTVVPALTEALSDVDATVRLGALHSLRDIGPPAAAAAGKVVPFITDPRLGDRAQQTLRRMGSGAVPPLLAALKGEDRAMRIAAIMTLWPMGAEAKSAVSALEELVADEDAEVAKTAKIALRKLKARIERPHMRF
jgi:HEAT repeat protein